jgi:hypothetical protein
MHALTSPTDAAETFTVGLAGCPGRDGVFGLSRSLMERPTSVPQPTPVA